MTLTATMDGQDQRLLVGTRHTVHITLADTPGEADLRDITISLRDLDPRPLPVTCPAGRNGHLSLEPDQSLQCTARWSPRSRLPHPGGPRDRVRPQRGPLVRTTSLHYNGFLPPPPPRAPVHSPLAPDPASGRPPHAPTSPRRRRWTRPRRTRRTRARGPGEGAGRERMLGGTAGRKRTAVERVGRQW